MDLKKKNESVLKGYRTNEDMLRMVREEIPIMTTIRKRLKNWLGHVLRENSLMKIASNSRMVGKKTATGSDAVGNVTTVHNNM